MAVAGDSFTIVLKQAHLEWGEFRHTGSRNIRYGEGYIPIPAETARSLRIYNSNSSNVGLGYNIFNYTSVDNHFRGQLKATGCSRAGDIYAKQLHGYGNLRALGAWFAHSEAVIGDRVEVRWVSPIDIVIRHFRNT